MARIAHLSDLHFGEEDAAQTRELAEDIRAQALDAVVVSGDLTRRATRGEFAAASQFLEALGAPLLVVPGNHDIPRYDLYDRFFHPRRRWLAARPAAYQDLLELEGLRLIGLDSVSRAQWHLDWAAGAISDARRARLAEALARPAEGATVLVCHHPLRHPPWAQARRAPRNAELTISLLQANDVAAVLCGHLHRPEITELGPAGPLQIVAPSALSPRGDGRPNGWVLMTAGPGGLDITLREWREGAWSSRAMASG